MIPPVRDHMRICDHQAVWEDFKRLGDESKNFILDLKSLFIKKNKKTLIRTNFHRNYFYFSLLLRISLPDALFATFIYFIKNHHFQ